MTFQSRNLNGKEQKSECERGTCKEETHQMKGEMGQENAQKFSGQFLPALNFYLGLWRERGALQIYPKRVTWANGC